MVNVVMNNGVRRRDNGETVIISRRKLILSWELEP